MSSASGEPPHRTHVEPTGSNDQGDRPADADWDSISRALRQYLRSGSHGSTTDAVTDALREGILEGALPPRVWMREEDLASALQVSRTPIREALRRLADEHLVRRTANRGSIVEPMTIDDVYAVYSLREVLEGFAVHTVTLVLPKGLLGTLVGIREESLQATRAGDNDRLAKLNRDFHRAIRAETDNTYLIQFLEQIENVVRRSGVTVYASADRQQHNLAEHTAIIDAIASGDADLARKIAIDHIRKAREARVRAIIGQQADF